MAKRTIIYCEFCGLPHTVTATHCDRCGHNLGSEPYWDGLALELPELKYRMLLGVAALVIIIVLNVLLFGGVGYILLVAPIAWIGNSAYRYHVRLFSLDGG